MTDYLAMVNRFGTAGAIGMMDCTYLLLGDRPARAASRDADIAALEFLVPCLALAIKSASIARIAETLVETYLGGDAGRRVLDGAIERGKAETVNAVHPESSDLQGFTRIADTRAAASSSLGLLNDDADAVATAVHKHGGQVLKFIGDGILAMFPDGRQRPDACGRRTRRGRSGCARKPRQAQCAAQQRRAAGDRPSISACMSARCSTAISARADRLDYTVVGPAVNEVARDRGDVPLARSVGDHLLDLRRCLCGAALEDLVSVGRYALRGVRRPEKLFTLDPDASG